VPKSATEGPHGHVVRQHPTCGAAPRATISGSVSQQHTVWSSCCELSLSLRLLHPSQPIKALRNSCCVKFEYACMHNALLAASRTSPNYTLPCNKGGHSTHAPLVIHVNSRRASPSRQLLASHTPRNGHSTHAHLAAHTDSRHTYISNPPHTSTHTCPPTPLLTYSHAAKTGI
jgi:hypothetical protein